MKKLLHCRHFIRYLGKRFAAHSCIRTASALTYATVFALIPALVLVLSIFRTTSFFKNYTHTFWHFLFANVVPDAAGNLTRDYLEQFVRHARGLTIAGTVIFMLSVITLFLMLDRSLNGIWHVQRSRSLLWRVFHSSLWILGVPVFIGVALSVGGWVIASTSSGGGSASVAQSEFLDLIPCALNAIALIVLYRVTPRAYVPWRHALVCGVLVALALEGLKAGLGEFVRYVVAEKVVYGPFAGVPVFLLWMHACWISILAGAVAIAAWPHRIAPPAQAWPSLAQRVALSTQVLAFLDSDRPPGVEELQQATLSGFDELAWVFDRLAELDLIHYAGRTRIARTGKASPQSEVLIAHYLSLPSEVH